MKKQLMKLFSIAMVTFTLSFGTVDNNSKISYVVSTN